MKRKKFFCFECSKHFEDIEDLNKHIVKTGCNDSKKFTDILYVKALIHFVF